MGIIWFSPFDHLEYLSFLRIRKPTDCFVLLDKCMAPQREWLEKWVIFALTPLRMHLILKCYRVGECIETKLLLAALYWVLGLRWVLSLLEWILSRVSLTAFRIIVGTDIPQVCLWGHFKKHKQFCPIDGVPGWIKMRKQVEHKCSPSLCFLTVKLMG